MIENAYFLKMNQQNRKLFSHSKLADNNTSTLETINILTIDKIIIYLIDFFVEMIT